jgi:hypothetical protein
MGSFGGTQPPTSVPIPPPKPTSPGLNSDFNNLFGGPDGAGTVAVGTMKDAAAGKGAGAPTDISSLFNAIRNAGVKAKDEGQAAINEQFSQSGMRFSSDLARATVDYQNQYDKDLNAQLEQLLFQSQESAKDRQLTSAVTLEETFGNAALNFAPSAVVAGGAANSTGGNTAIQAGVESAAIAAMFI